MTSRTALEGTPHPGVPEIREEFADKVLKIDGDSKYCLIGVPFYNNQDENQFKESLEVVLKR